jgi:hypothetical protein
MCACSAGSRPLGCSEIKENAKSWFQCKNENYFALFSVPTVWPCRWRPTEWHICALRADSWCCGIFEEEKHLGPFYIIWWIFERWWSFQSVLQCKLLLHKLNSFNHVLKYSCPWRIGDENFVKITTRLVTVVSKKSQFHVHKDYAHETAQNCPPLQITNNTGSDFTIVCGVDPRVHARFSNY